MQMSLEMIEIVSRWKRPMMASVAGKAHSRATELPSLRQRGTFLSAWAAASMAAASLILQLEKLDSMRGWLCVVVFEAQRERIWSIQAKQCLQIFACTGQYRSLSQIIVAYHEYKTL
jgi:uncharacterized protein (DUF2141 family)